MSRHQIDNSDRTFVARQRQGTVRRMRIHRPPRRDAVAEPKLSESDIKLLAQIASGVTTDVAARKLELSARTLRRRLREICDVLDVNTPMEAVGLAGRPQLI